MYKIQYFERKLFADPFHCFDDDEVYSIWRFYPRTSLRELLSTLATSSPCCPELFPLMYWLALAISLCGLFFSCREFLLIYHGSWKLSTSRDRKFRVIPRVFRRNVRLVSAAFMTKTWASLFIGIVTVKPSLITSWLVFYFAVFCLELTLWIAEILFSVIKLDARSVWTHCVPFGTYLVIRCIRDIFSRVIERRGSIHELELLPALAH